MISVDLHSHTKYSHANASVAEMHASALAKKLAVFGFSEHSPRPAGYTYPSDYQERLNANFADYHREVRALRDLDSGAGGGNGMLVLLGLEMDYIRAEEAYVRQICAAEDYDYIIGGLHFLDHWGFDASADDWKDLSEQQAFAYYEHYYEDLFAMSRCGIFHIAAHPDLIKIFSVHVFKRWLQKSASLELVKKALKGLKDGGMVMEVSSAGLRKPCGEIYPCPEIMALASGLGLDISFGSDSHCVNTVTHGFDLLAAHAKKFGYSESVYFQNKKAVRRPF